MFNFRPLMYPSRYNLKDDRKFSETRKFFTESTWRSRISNTVNHVHQAKFRVLMVFLAGNDYWPSKDFLYKKNNAKDFCDFYVKFLKESIRKKIFQTLYILFFRNPSESEENLTATSPTPKRLD